MTCSRPAGLTRNSAGSARGRRDEEAGGGGLVILRNVMFHSVGSGCNASFAAAAHPHIHAPSGLPLT
jgi:hypothetical protein